MSGMLLSCKSKLCMKHSPDGVGNGNPKLEISSPVGVGNYPQTKQAELAPQNRKQLYIGLVVVKSDCRNVHGFYVTLGLGRTDLSSGKYCAGDIHAGTHTRTYALTYARTYTHSMHWLVTIQLTNDKPYI